MRRLCYLLGALVNPPGGGSGDPAGPPPATPTTGSLAVTITTYGLPPLPTGFGLVMDGALPPTTVDANGTTLIRGS